MSIFSQPSQSSSRGPARTTRSVRPGGFTRRNAGFTLIELLVVVAIITLITLTLLLQQSKFDSSVLLRGAAYSVALSVRQAQIYGTSVFGANTIAGTCPNAPTATTCFAKGYGLYLTAPSTSYLLFADIDGDGQYDVGSDPIIKTFTLSRYTIGEVCAISGGLYRCTGSDTSSGSAAITSLTILFKRPNPDACFVTDTDAAGTCNHSSGVIQIKSNAGTKRFIKIYTTGQLDMQSNSL